MDYSQRINKYFTVTDLLFIQATIKVLTIKSYGKHMVLQYKHESKWRRVFIIYGPCYETFRKLFSTGSPIDSWKKSFETSTSPKVRIFWTLCGVPITSYTLTNKYYISKISQENTRDAEKSRKLRTHQH